MNSRTIRITLCLILSLSLLCSCGASGSGADAEAAAAETAAPAEASPAPAPEHTPAPAVAAEPSGPEQPVVTGADLRDGVYEIETEAGYPLFRPGRTELTVTDGRLSAVLYMASDNYSRLFAGTKDEAAAADEGNWIAITPGPDEGTFLFTVEIGALDREDPFAIFGGKTDEWNDCPLCFRSDSLPPEAYAESSPVSPGDLDDGEYTVEVTLRGGSGRASIRTPARLFVSGGEVTAEIVWGSSNYDFMLVGEERILPVTTEGGSTFLIPVALFDRPIAVSADTTAMSTPHLIDYTLRFDSSTLQKAGRTPR